MVASAARTPHLLHMARRALACAVAALLLRTRKSGCSHMLVRPALLTRTMASSCFACAHRYEKMRAAAIMFQAAIRRSRARKDYQGKRRAAIAIQARARSHFAQAEFEQMRRLAIKFQVPRRQSLEPMGLLSVIVDTHPAREPLLSLPLSDGHCTNWSPLERCLFVSGVLRPCVDTCFCWDSCCWLQTTHPTTERVSLATQEVNVKRGVCVLVPGLALLGGLSHARSTPELPRAHQGGPAGAAGGHNHPDPGPEEERQGAVLLSQAVSKETMPARTPTTLTRLCSHTCSSVPSRNPQGDRNVL